jgi:uncharacterized membrane protein YphA (DoxX/SURF4 family)
MNDSMAQPDQALARLELSGWKTAVNWLSAVLLAVLFLVSGLWKITDAPSAAVRMSQALVPESLSLAAALGFGVAETYAGVLLVVPRFRRWGAWLSGLLLIAFLVYFAVHYSALRGEECSCFPWIKRAVGPAFFIGDGIMLLLAVLAGVWVKPSRSQRSALLTLAAVSVFAGVSYGAVAVRQSGVMAPDSITVDGRPYSLQEGKIFLYYFDPECPHCIEAAEKMGRLNWGDTRVIVVPIAQPQFSQSFLEETGLRAAISTDAAVLRKVFPFVDAPAGVALEDGRQKAAITRFDGEEPAATLKRLGFVQ